MKPRIILTILVTLLEEIALAAFVLWGLPMLGVEVPLGGLIAMMAGLVVYGVFTYRLGSRVLRKKPLVGLPDVVGSKGKVVEALTPVGTVRISSELWEAKSASRKIKTGEEVIVIRRDGLKLIVRKTNPADSKND